ncbi:MAG: hypothetical protein M5R42_08025 [Rhodocyclaceae bacterium]|nr:hypothetical protein [Rhodocyclaceae bacterium]
MTRMSALSAAPAAPMFFSASASDFDSKGRLVPVRRERPRGAQQSRREGAGEHAAGAAAFQDQSA